MFSECKGLLQQLIRTPSVNPAFASQSSESLGEMHLTDLLQGYFEARQWPWLRQPVHPGRDNLVALCGLSKSSAPPLLWEVHQDTVGTVGMSIEPFTGQQSQGRIWGRGACDVKGGMAAMLAALSRAQEAESLAQPVILALTVNEECGFTGAMSLIRLWSDESTPADIVGPLEVAELKQLRPAAALVAEPTELDVVVAHKGVVRWRCHARGRAAHTSQPELGANAIVAVCEVVRALDRYQRDQLAVQTSHSLCGGPTLCVSTISGGTGVNTVPDHVVIDIDRRLMPGEDPDVAYQAVCDYIAEQVTTGEVAIEHEQPSNRCKGLADQANRAWGEQVASAARVGGHHSQLVGVPYGTDAWVFAANGIPTVVFGPGSIAQAHTADEWIDIEQLEKATKILYHLATRPVA